MPFQWPVEFAFGISEIDEAHQEMFQRINQIVDACEQGKGAEQLESMLGFFQEELIQHFETEEALMKACNYPERKQHQQAHEDFMRRVRQLQLELEKSQKAPETLSAFNEAMIDWVFDHVCMEDRALGEFVRPSHSEKTDVFTPVNYPVPDAN